MPPPPLLLLLLLCLVALHSTTTTALVLRPGETLNLSKRSAQITGSTSTSSNSRSLQIQVGAASCSSANVPPCAQRATRDLLFLVDSSNSMDPNRFYGEMLDYTQLLFCAFNSADANQAGMIIFANLITLAIPLSVWTADQWFTQVNAVRATQNTANPACCTCCTPHAEAFQAATKEFAVHGVKSHQQIAFMITDGTPYQNTHGIYKWSPTLNEAIYALQIVPQQAGILKTAGARVFLVGVPNAQGRPPETNYFAGIPDPSKVPPGGSPTTQCYSRNPPKKFCGVMTTPPFPIVSKPVADNLFGTSSWDIQALIDDTLTSLCKVPPTGSPTLAPSSNKPTTKGPTHVPTTVGPTLPPTKLPTTHSPTIPILDHLDLHIVFDHSLSMTWDHASCRAAPGADQSAPDNLVCWSLFLGFANQLATAIEKLGPNGQAMGWAGLNSNHNLGLSVNLLGFACHNSQTTPVVINFGQNLDTPDKFQQALLAAKNFVPDGGTCPSQAIDSTVASIQFSLNRPFDVVVFTTDGVFYDMPLPARAALGLQYFGVPVYALAIAIPLNGQNPGGLTRQEMVTQKEQLTALVGNTGQLYNLGADGYNLLSSITTDIIKKLPDAYANYFNTFILQDPFWCGYTSGPRCADTDPAEPTAQFCTWDWQHKRCISKPRCARPQSMCGQTWLGITDVCCQWNTAGKHGKGKCELNPDSAQSAACQSTG